MKFKISKLFLLLFVSLTFIKAYANECYTPANPSYSCCENFFSGFEVYGSALYWRPTYDGVQYATELTNTGGELKYTTPNSNWGYRFGGLLELGNSQFYLEANYTFFRQGNFNSTRSVGNIFPVFAPFVTNNFDFGSGRIDSKYQTINITGNYLWLCCNRWQSYLSLGARYFKIKETEDYLYLDPTGPIPTAPGFQRYSLIGWGPRLGLDVSLTPFSLPILECLGFKGEVAGIVGMANQTNLVKSLSQGGVFPQGPLDFPDRFRTIFAVDFQFEIFYEYCVCNCWLKLAGGYELNYYFDGRFRVDTTNSLGIASRSTSGIGYGGPYIELSLRY